MTRKQHKSTEAPALAELDAKSLDLLTLLALSEGDTTVARWLAAAEQVGVLEGRARTRKTAELRTLGRSLVAAGLAVERAPGYFSVPTRSAWPVLEALVRDPKRRSRLYAAGDYGYYAYERSRLRSSSTADLRLAILDEDAAAVQKLVGIIGLSYSRGDLGRYLASIIGAVNMPDRLRLLPPDARDDCLWPLLDNAIVHLRAISDDVLHAAAAANDKKLRLAAARLWVLRGRPELAAQSTGLPKYGSEGIALLHAFWARDYGKAAELGTQAVAQMKARKHKVLPDLEGVCHALAGVVGARDEPRELHALSGMAGVMKATRAVRSDVSSIVAGMLAALLDDAVVSRPRWSGHGIPKELAASAQWEDEYRYRLEPHWTGFAGWLVPWLEALHDRWLELVPAGQQESEARRDSVARGLEAWAERAAQNGYAPIAVELRATADAWAERTPNDPGLVAAFTKPSAWRAALAGLERVAEDAAATRAKQASTAKVGPRLVWQVDVIDGLPAIEPRLRKTPRSRKGSAVSLSNLLDALPEYLTTADRRVLAMAEPDPYGGRRRSIVLPPRALAALARLPNVIDAEGTALQVRLGEASLTTRSTAAGVSVTLEPTALLDEDVWARRTGDEVEVFERSETLDAVVGLFGRSGVLEIPSEGVPDLSRTLSRLCAAGSVAVTGTLAPQTRHETADARPVLTMVWNGESLSIDASVAPLGLNGPHVRPGIGVERLSATLPAPTTGPGAIVECQRDLDDERERMEAVQTQCPTLASYSERPLHWLVRSLPDALEIILELQCMGEAIVAAWPKGRPLSPPKPRELEDLKIKVATRRDWIGVDAELSVDEASVMSYRAIMAGRVGRRFVALGPDRFVVLSEKLRRRIDLLAALGPAKDEGIKASTPLLTAAADELFDGIDVDVDAKGRARIDRLRTLQDAKPPALRGFRGKLRDYQTDGLTWLWRRTEGELGACLADDMGLGKTIQALALLRMRAKRGPALVVCPTSVVFNWCREAERFTPGLRVSALADAEDRAASIAGASARDVLVCSYGLLTTNSDALAKVEWSTVVFDEAHALKNERTQRTRAARRLRAEARIGLTGTPVENRVQELWSLFAVLVPGLFGPKEWFEGRFADPIARGDRDAGRILRRILQPFLLRRTKAEVLDELPPRTEVTIAVEPNADQAAYYEAIRARAKDRLAFAREQRQSAKERTFLLAEILRLRQAAVDPQLLDDTAAPRGAKLDIVVEHVVDLARQGHRTLVFTQFLGSLRRLSARLTEAGLTVLTLQGSTSARDRARLVDSFQAGDADVFVLSLRAGGVGMNLTAADHVVHVDPWWNPAVEDQATDRTHRIGQRRPVTVARFVTEGTIEEKIMELHEDKRGMVDDLIGGLKGGGLDLEELRRLIGG